MRPLEALQPQILLLLGQPLQGFVNILYPDRSDCQPLTPTYRLCKSRVAP